MIGGIQRAALKLKLRERWLLPRAAAELGLGAVNKNKKIKIEDEIKRKKKL